MKIYTKKGDTGATSLIGGNRVAKNHPRVEAYGHIDELISVIGVVRAHLNGTDLGRLLPSIQTHLMHLSAHLANDSNHVTLTPVEPDAVTELEQGIDQMQAQLPPLNSFVYPGPPLAAACCHVARTVCRRAERSVVALDANDLLPIVVPYLNRLSDYLFVLSRYLTLPQN